MKRCLGDAHAAEHCCLIIPRGEAISAFVPFDGALEGSRCVATERIFGHGNRVHRSGHVLNIRERCHRRHFVKATVQYPDGTPAISHARAGAPAIVTTAPSINRKRKQNPRPRFAGKPSDELRIMLRVPYDLIGLAKAVADIF